MPPPIRRTPITHSIWRVHVGVLHSRPMELPPPSPTFLAAALAAALFLVAVLRGRPARKYDLPPGPRPWPVIGNLDLIGPLPHHSARDLSARHGPLVSLRLGSFHAVVASSPDMARFFLRTRDLAFVDRPRTAAGRKYIVDGAGSPFTPEEFRWLIDEHFFLNGVLNIGDVIPWLSCLDPQGYVKRMKRSAKMFDRFLEHVLDEHNERRRREGEEFVARDMVDVLLELADDPNLEVPIHRDGVKGFILDLIGGGTDTSAVTVEWAMSELLRNPEVLAKATEELDRVIGRDRLVAEEDIPNLPYMEAVVKETMRLHPVAPLLTPRLCREDVSVGGYDVPAGTRVLINIWAIGRDPAVWEAPMAFRPERFVGSGVDVKGQDLELLPFGSGRRMCPGIGLGLKMVHMILANLLHAFAWRLPDGVAAEDLSMEETFGLTVPRRVPLEAVAEPKLPAHLYALS
ncbi:hypothetical protein PAHAL_9G457600 [Panicum hallii]|uniref:Uncharacterized protein n=1 Tax=Panicum hallii TaxID=206008 RepID=A0A2S3IQG4_9POAL|nr:flavonoid 3'-monooxygenase-like isoform X3 [Panicum hallii]PAN49579.1 hypothetical protein PAHAL_9G457600 [Panicum hallii]